MLGFEGSNPHIGFTFCLRDARELEPGIRTQELETVSRWNMGDVLVHGVSSVCPGMILYYLFVYGWI